jgi:gamma-glutamyltranspeptidase/glutathione hydrolase/leukotriene-C4 hydrolase
MTVRIPPKIGEKQQVFTVNFREKAPAAAKPDMFYEDPNLSITGGLAVGVPGEVLGLHTAHERWGKLPWKEIIKPSIELAKNWQLEDLEDIMIQVGESAYRRRPSV